MQAQNTNFHVFVSRLTNGISDYDGATEVHWAAAPEHSFDLGALVRGELDFLITPMASPNAHKFFAAPPTTPKQDGPLQTKPNSFFIWADLHHPR